MAEWITVSTASRKADVSDRTIRNWIAKGSLIAKKEKGQWLIDDSSLSEIGTIISDDNGKAERATTVSVPLEHYDGLTTRLGQVEAENSQYRLMLKAHDDEVGKLQSEAAELKLQAQDRLEQLRDKAQTAIGSAADKVLDYLKG